MKEKCPSTDRKGKGARLTQNAQGLVEFAIILPVILVTLFVLIELARVLHAWLAIENGARAGVRYAVTAEYNPAHCPGGVCESKAQENQARVDSIHDAAWAGSASVVRSGIGDEDVQPDESTYFNVIVCDPKNLVAPATTFDTYNCTDGEKPGEPGEQVVVVVEFNHPLFTPLLTSIWPQLRLSSEREAKVETYRIPLPVGTAPAYNSPTPRPTNTPLPSPTPPGPLPPPSCEYVRYSIQGNISEYWVKANVKAYPEGDPPPGVYNIVVTEIRVGHGDNPPVLNTFNWTTWNTSGGSSTRTDASGETGYIEYEPDPPYNVGYCTPEGCPEDYYFYGRLTLDFGGPLSKRTSVRLQVLFPDYDLKCSAWVSYEHPGYPKDTQAPYETNTPNPNPETDTPTVVWNTPIPSATTDPTGPDD